MNPSALFIRRPVMTLLIMSALCFFGILSYKFLPVSDMPNVVYPTITVNSSQPGASPQYMANFITSPLEQNLTQISGLRTMTSSSTSGSSSIVLNFDLKTDIQAKEVEVSAAIAAALPNLPTMQTPPTFNLKNPSDTPIIFLVVTSDTLSMADLYNYGYNFIAQPLGMVNGVSSAQVQGIPAAVRVEVDPMKMGYYNLDFNDVSSALNRASSNTPLGTLQSRYYDYLLEPQARITTAREYGNIILNDSGGTPLYIHDIAEVKNGLSQLNPFYRYEDRNGSHNMVLISIFRLPNSNTVDIAKQVFEKLPELTSAMPKAMTVTTFFSRADEIVSSTEDAQATLILALFLVIFVIFLCLGRLFDALIPSIVLPMAIIMTFIAMHFFGFTLDILSLLALTLAIGFIVDDAIVVLENIVRHLEMGKTPYQAALDGARQIGPTVLSMTLALSAVFIPFIWMQGIVGRFFHEFAVTLTCTILCSGIISLALNPMLCSRFLHALPAQRKPNRSQRVGSYIARGYIAVLQRTIRWKKTTIALGILTVVCSVLILRILPTDLFPASNMNILHGWIYLQEGASRIYGVPHLEKLATRLRKDPYQDGFVVVGGVPSDDSAFVYARLVPSHERPSATTVANLWTKELSSIVGIQPFFIPHPVLNLRVGSDGAGTYEYVLYGQDQQALYAAAHQMLDALRKLPEITGVNSDLDTQNPELLISVDRERANIHGISISAIESVLQGAYAGNIVTTFPKGTNLYDVILEVAPEYNLMTSDLDLLYVKSPTSNAMVPLSALATWQRAVGVGSVNHYGIFNAVTLYFNLNKGHSLSTALASIQRAAHNYLPTGITGHFTGAGEVFKESVRSIGWLTLLAIFVIYALLGILYESLVHPLTILSALPTAILGGLVTLWIFHEPLTLFSALGLIVLIGLVQKNGILLVDFALEHLRTGDARPEQAIIHACRERFRPIIMTTLAAMLGALPVALGVGQNGAANRPLGLVVVGGLFFSQIMTLFLTPVVFLYMDRLAAICRVKK